MHAARLATDGPATAFAAARQHRDDCDARLRWLVAADAEAARRARLFRSPREEREMLMMRRAVSPERAFALFGLLLGTLPPAAIFLRLVLLFDWEVKPLGLIFIPMLLVCAALGRVMGRRVGGPISEFERGGRVRFVLFTAAAALGWATVTGASGGAIFFGVGAIFGVFCAIAVALPAFAAFAAFHRLLARGGMIDARHLRPLAWGVAATAAAAVLGL
jgi:hypothetical protein